MNRFGSNEWFQFKILKTESSNGIKIYFGLWDTRYISWFFDQWNNMYLGGVSCELGNPFPVLVLPELYLFTWLADWITLHVCGYCVMMCLRGVEWVHDLFLFPLVLGKK